MRWRADRSCLKPVPPRPICLTGWSVPIWRPAVAKGRMILFTAIEIGDTTIHRIVEQEGPFFDAMQFFPTLTKELLDQNRGWLQPRFIDARDQLMLCIQ